MSSNLYSSVVALNCGLAPHAEPLDCADLRGTYSVFGESVRLPRPVGRWNTHKGTGKKLSDCAGADDYMRGLVLWDSAEPAPAGERAAAVCTEGPLSGEPRPLCPLDMPADTYLTGCCTSTFSVARQLVEDGLLPDWGSVVASCQKEGRGRLRRPWHSPRGNLYVSFRLPEGPLLQGDHASLAVGYLSAKAFRELGYNIKLKWPNDLLLDEHRKVGGILLEERDGVLIAGLGVNLAEAPDRSLLRKDGATEAAVLLPLAGADDAAGGEEPLAPFSLWRTLVSRMILEYSRLASTRDLSVFFAALEPLMAWKERDVLVRDGGEIIARGRFLGLGPGGGIALLLQNGEMQELFSGSLVPAFQGSAD